MPIKADFHNTVKNLFNLTAVLLYSKVRDIFGTGKMTSRTEHCVSSIKSAVILASVAGTVGIAALVVQALSAADNTLSQNCGSVTEYNAKLPSSHPNNRCAVQDDDLSWTNWLSGKSRSGQFHFIDLLELLHGHERKPLDDMTPNNSGSSTSRL